MRLYIFIPILLIALSGCTKRVDIELNDDANSRLVVDGGITTETKSHRIELTRSSSYFAQEAAPRETGAIVSITDGSNTFALTEKEPGVYETAPTAHGVIGNTYTLNIKLKNNKEYTAKSTITKVEPIDEVIYEYEEFPMEDEEFAYYTFYLFVQEPEGIGDNYMFNVYIDGQLDNDTLNEISFEKDEMFDGEYLPGIDFYYIREDFIVNNTYQIKVDMLSISIEHYDYMMAVMLETDWKGGMFDGPPANVPTNIDNGALGFFWASACTSYEFELTREEN